MTGNLNLLVHLSKEGKGILICLVWGWGGKERKERKLKTLHLCEKFTFQAMNKLCYIQSVIHKLKANWYLINSGQRFQYRVWMFLKKEVIHILQPCLKSRQKFRTAAMWLPPSFHQQIHSRIYFLLIFTSRQDIKVVKTITTKWTTVQMNDVRFKRGKEGGMDEKEIVVKN